MALKSYSRGRRTVPAILAGLLWLPCLLAQTNYLTVEGPEKVAVKRGGPATVKIKAAVRPGFHVNSNKPNEDYLIPLRLTWTPGPLESPAVAYPKAQQEKYEFSEKPLAVYTGNFELTTTFKVPANAPVGPAIMLGKLRYQACNDRSCFPPKTIEVKLPVQVQ